jgi:ribA/ribD-fused uncharacterized protein
MRDYHRSICCNILLTLFLVSLISTSPAHAMDCTNQSPSRMNVCELFAGIAVMSAVLQSIGWHVSMLCESNTALASFLKLRFPGADVQLNVEDKPWLQWAKDGLMALAVVAGVPCQPFSPIGQMRMHEDPRALMALHVCDAAVALHSSYIILEEVPNFVDLDHIHGIFTRTKEYFSEKGFTLMHILRPDHSECGGWTGRKRVIIFFTRGKQASELQLGLSSVARGDPPCFSPDLQRNWLDHGYINPSGTHFQYDEHSLVPGATVYIWGDTRLMRVQSTSGTSMVLRVRDTKSRARPMTVQLCRLQCIYSSNNIFKILSRGLISQTVRAWGEAPGKGGPLIFWNGGLYTGSVDDCATLNEVTSSDSAIMVALGFTEEQRRSAIGNCVVDSMVRPLFVQLTRHVELGGGCSLGGGGLVKITSEGATSELGSSDKSAVLTGRPSPLRGAHVVASDAVYFYSQEDVHTGYLSQWFQCLFTDDAGVSYISAEQYMMAAKARTHNEMETYDSIMMASDQATIKRLGRSMSNYNEEVWSQIRPSVLLAGNTLKFGQNSDLSSKLIHTSTSHLAEASASDTICGIGISVADAYNGARHRGQNLLGIALMEVRSSLLQRPSNRLKRPSDCSLDASPSKKQSWVQCDHGAVRVSGSQQQPDGYDMERCVVPSCVTEASAWYLSHQECHGQANNAGTPAAVSELLCSHSSSSVCVHCNSLELLCELRLCSECCFNSSCSCSAPNQGLPASANGATAALALTSQSARAAASAGPSRPDIEVILLPLSASKGTVFLSNLGLPISKSCGHTGTGSITQLAKSMSAGQRVYFIGRCQYGAGKAWVTATISAKPRMDAPREFTLKELVGMDVHRPVSLAIAKFGSMLTGHTSLALMEPLLNSTGEFEVGALSPRHIAPERIAQSSITATRQEALLSCRAGEEQTKLALTAASLATSSAALADYLMEWVDATTITDLKDIPDGLLSQIPKLNDPALESMLFSCTSNMAYTKSFTPPTQKPTSFRPSGIQDIKHQSKIQERQDFLDKLLVYYRLSRSEGVTHRELIQCRPEADVCCIGDYYEQARGTVWDLRGSTPKPMDFSTPITTHINTNVWYQYIQQLGLDKIDKQLVILVMKGVCTMNNMCYQTTNASPLISLSDGIGSITSEIARLVGLGYLLEYDSQPFEPILCNPQGAVIKSDNKTFRRISDNGFPQGIMFDSDLVRVIAANVATKHTLELPHELKVNYKDTARDTCVLRHIGDRLGWVLKEWCDDLKDWFYQLKQHCSEYHKSCFIFHDPVADRLKWYVETVMGMGYVHTSNISQRFTNSIIHIFLHEFREADRAFIDEERKTNKVLDDYLTGRSGLSTTNQLSESRLESVHGYTDDIKGMVLEPPNHSRLAVMLAVWYKLCIKLGIRTAAPCKRIIGSTNRYLGIISIAILAIQVLPQDKVMRALAGLALASSGHQSFEEYNKLVGLLGFTQYALSLPKAFMRPIYEPMADGYKNGPRSRVKSDSRRRSAWSEWSARLIKSNGAPCTNAVDFISKPLPSTVHVFVWYGDAAIKGTSKPAMGAYAHSLYWVFNLTKKHLDNLHISALEYLTILGELIIFGNMLPTPSDTCKFIVLIQSDSLNAALDLTDDAKKSPIMQFIYDKMVERPEYHRLKHVIKGGHIWGEGNSITDDLSRGDLQLAIDTCTMLGVQPKRLPIPSAFVHLVNECVDHAISLGASKRH